MEFLCKGETLVSQREHHYPPVAEQAPPLCQALVRQLGRGAAYARRRERQRLG